jgi:outer membrane protein assembly factor BamB
LTASLILEAGTDVSAQARRKREPPPRPATLLLPAAVAWTVVLTAPPRSGAVAAGSIVAVPLETDELHAFDGGTGNARWTRPYAAAVPPASTGALIIAATRTSVDGLDPSTGEARWTQPLDEPVVEILATSSAVYLRRALSVSALAASTGAALWTHTFPNAPLAIAPGTAALAVTTADSRLTLLSQASGSLTGTLTAPAWGTDVIVVGSSSRAAWGLDPASGSIRWEWPLGGSASSVAADTTQAYVTSLDNLLRGVKRENGHQRWQQDLRTRAQAPLFALDGAVLTVSALSPTLALYNSKTGAPLGTFDAPGKVLGPPLVDRSFRPGTVSIVLVLRDGQLIGLRSNGLSFPELPATPLLALPGRTLPRERLPGPP